MSEAPPLGTAGALAVRASRPTPVPRPPVAEATPGLALRDVLTTMFLRRGLIVAAFLLPVLAAVGATLVIPPRWPVEGLLLVQVSRETSGATDPTGSGPTVLSVEAPKVVQSEFELLMSDAVLRRAVTAAGPGRIFPGLGEPRLLGLLPPVPPEEWVPVGAGRLRRALSGVTSNTSNIIRVTVSLPDRERSMAALTAVLAAYAAHRAEAFASGDVRVLSLGSDRVGTELRGLDEEIAAVRSTNRILDLTQDVSIANARRDNVTTRIDALRERKAATDAQLEAARSRLAAYPQRVLAASETTNLTPNDDARNELTRLTLERQRVALQYAPDWPPLRELDARIATLRGSIAANARTRFETVREVRNPAVEQVTLRIASLEVDSDAMGRQMAELETQRAEAAARAEALLRAETALRDLVRRREALETSYRQIASREASARVVEDARQNRSPTVTVVQAPVAAAEARDIRPAILVAGLVAGLIAATSAAVLLTLFRRSLATSDEASRGLGLPVLASIAPGAALEGGGRHRQLTDLSALILDARSSGEQLSLVQFVPASENDGRSAIALAVAAEIARERGLRTLLVDLETDGRAHLAAMGSHPVHEAGDPGNILAFNTVVPTLWIAFAARESLLGDPHTGIERTAALLDRLRRELDVVIVVAPDDAAGDYAMRRLTALMDANVLVLRAERTDVSVARRARDAVLSAGGRLVGFVMNGERQVVPPAIARLVA